MRVHHQPRYLYTKEGLTTNFNIYDLACEEEWCARRRGIIKSAYYLGPFIICAYRSFTKRVSISEHKLNYDSQLYIAHREQRSPERKKQSTAKVTIISNTCVQKRDVVRIYCLTLLSVYILANTGEMVKGIYNIHFHLSKKAPA